MANEKAKEIDFGDDFGAAALKINGIHVEIGAEGKSIHITSGRPVVITATTNTNASQTSTAISAAKEALEVGDRMKDGTVVIDVDLKNNIALFAPQGIFGGNSDFDQQDSVVKKANEQKLAGHEDWRRITDREASALAAAWFKVAPASLQLKGPGSLSFWGASNSYFTASTVSKGGQTFWLNMYYNRRNSFPVPIVRAGPARR